MLKAYARRRGLARMDVRFIFQAGDQVLLRQREVGKLKARSVGPYVFVRYEGKLGTVAVINMGDGRDRFVSAANLVPVDRDLAARRNLE